jgi:hypothetical protein
MIRELRHAAQDEARAVQSARVRRLPRWRGGGTVAFYG